MYSVYSHCDSGPIAPKLSHRPCRGAGQAQPPRLRDRVFRPPVDCVAERIILLDGHFERATVRPRCAGPPKFGGCTCRLKWVGDDATIIPEQLRTRAHDNAHRRRPSTRARLHEDSVDIAAYGQHGGLRRVLPSTGASADGALRQALCRIHGAGAQAARREPRSRRIHPRERSGGLQPLHRNQPPGHHRRSPYPNAGKGQCAVCLRVERRRAPPAHAARTRERAAQPRDRRTRDRVHSVG